jgi:uncharacterized OB-fold protein
MALVKCKECGAEMSSGADACPQCGSQGGLMFAGQATGGCVFLLIVLAVVILGLLFF